MEMPERPSASIKLDISRPVLMTHLAPFDCRPAMSSCNSSGMGGFSNSAKRVPSKSVESNLIGGSAGMMRGPKIVQRTGVCQNSILMVQEKYDEAMFDFSQGEYDRALAKLEEIVRQEPEHFDALLAIGMTWYRKGDYQKAIEYGHRAEKLRPREQLVHTNLSLFYMKAGDKKTAEHHGLQARIASWKADKTPPGEKTASDPELEMAKPKTAPVAPPETFPDMPWKKKPPV